MDDATIVRTLAEFEGYVNPQHDRWIGLEAVYAVNMTKLYVPPYLTSYDAVARVWQKALGFNSIGETAARDLVARGADGDGEWMSKHPNWIKAFVTATPREHSEALATAIAKHKEVGK